MSAPAPRVQTRRSVHGGWVIETLARDGSHVRVVRVDDRVVLRVADRATPAAATTEVVLHRDGRVDVDRVCAPPVLVIGPDGGRLLPSTSDDGGAGALSDGDLVVVCSADALEALPSGITGVLDWPLRQMSLPTVMTRLGHDVPSGAVVLVRRTDDDEEEP